MLGMACTCVLALAQLWYGLPGKSPVRRKQRRNHSGLAYSPFFFEFMADIFALTEEVLQGTDLELVDIERAPMGLLRVTLDRPEGVRIEDCEQVSKQLSRVFEVEGIDYQRLEVGSPGVDRPLKKEADFIRFAGERIEIRLRQPRDNRKVFAGVLQPADQGVEVPVFTIELDPVSKNSKAELVSFTFNDIDRARLDPVLDFKGKKR